MLRDNLIAACWSRNRGLGEPEARRNNPTRWHPSPTQQAHLELPTARPRFTPHFLVSQSTFSPRYEKKKRANLTYTAFNSFQEPILQQQQQYTCILPFTHTHYRPHPHTSTLKEPVRIRKKEEDTTQYTQYSKQSATQDTCLRWSPIDSIIHKGGRGRPYLAPARTSGRSFRWHLAFTIPVSLSLKDVVVDTSSPGWLHISFYDMLLSSPYSSMCHLVISSSPIEEYRIQRDDISLQM